MANIDIEKKNKKSSAWLWIVGILAIVGIIWLIAAGDDKPELEEAALYEEDVTAHLPADYPAINKAGTELLLVA